MKLTFNHLFLFSFFLLSSPIYSRDIILVENMSSLEEGELIKKLLITKFRFPKELITLKNTTKCSTKSDAIVHLCMDRFSELHIAKMNHFVVKNSLGVFLNQEQEAGE